MLLGEPERTPYDLNFVLFGIPVRVHPLFWLVSLVFGAQGRNGVGILTWIAAVFISILVHELGHALMMLAHGLRPWIVLYAMGGLTGYDTRQYSRSRASTSTGAILISLAGPVAGFLLAAILLGVLYATVHGAQIDFYGGPWDMLPHVAMQNEKLADLFNDVFYICILWGLVNLLPVYPLDGGQVARELFMRFSPSDGIRQSMMLSMIAGGAMAVYGAAQWKSAYVALFFGYLAYMSYLAMQSYGDRNRW